MSRRLATLVQAARYLQVSDRTVSAYIGRGLFPAYRVPGKRAHFVNLDEVDTALASQINRAHFRPKSTKKFGPRAVIIDLPAQAEVVQPTEAKS